MSDRNETPPGIAEIEVLARAAMAALPEVFRTEAEKVVLRVEEFSS